MTHGRDRKTKKLDTINHYEEYERKGGSGNSKEWFHRKPYSIRGDTNGQRNSTGIQSDERRN